MTEASLFLLLACGRSKVLEHLSLLQQKLQPLLPTLGLHGDMHASWLCWGLGLYIVQVLMHIQGTCTYACEDCRPLLWLCHRSVHP